MSEVRRHVRDVLKPHQPTLEGDDIDFQAVAEVMQDGGAAASACS